MFSANRIYSALVLVGACLFILSMSCKKYKSFTPSALENRWWRITCMEVNITDANQLSQLPLTVSGRFYLNSDQTYIDSPAVLHICNRDDITPGPVFTQQNPETDKTWKVEQDEIVFNHWGHWRILQQEENSLRILCNRDGYQYIYRVDAE